MIFIMLYQVLAWVLLIGIMLCVLWLLYRLVSTYMPMHIAGEVRMTRLTEAIQSLIRLEKVKTGPYTFYQVFACNDVQVGSIEMAEDGFWNFWTDDKREGYWSEELLFAIAAELKKLNTPWREQIEKDLGPKPPETRFAEGGEA